MEHFGRRYCPYGNRGRAADNDYAAYGEAENEHRDGHDPQEHHTGQAQGATGHREG